VIMFCPKCKALMYPEGDFIVCRKCGFKRKKEGKTIVVNKQEEKEITFIEENEKSDVLPKTRIKCPKCGNNEAYWIFCFDNTVSVINLKCIKLIYFIGFSLQFVGEEKTYV